MERVIAPERNNKYYYEDNPFFKNGYGMPNCTTYAWGRWYELMGKKSNLHTGNAENWYLKSDGYQRGQIPKLGAVACWAKGNVRDESDGAGHVAIVEKINSDGSIVTSNSAWKSTNFFLKTYPKGYYKEEYEFQGFIYSPTDFEENVTESIEVGKRVLLKNTATVYQHASLGVKIPNSIKGKEYTVKQKDGNSLLLAEINSWVLTSECELKKDTSLTYTVKRGDTLSGIASKYGTTWQKIYNDNKSVIGSNPNVIKPSQILKIQK